MDGLGREEMVMSVCWGSRWSNYNNIVVKGHQINRLQMDIQEERSKKESQEVFDFTLKNYLKKY